MKNTSANDNVINRMQQILLLVSLILCTAAAQATTRGSTFMDMCLKDAEGNFPDGCVAYVVGLKEGMMNGARQGAYSAVGLAHASRTELQSAESSNPGVFLEFCSLGPIDDQELTKHLYDYLAANRSLLPQPMTHTFQGLLAQLSPIQACGEDEFQFTTAETE